MIEAIRTASSGVTDGKLILQFVTEDPKSVYAVALRPQAMADALVSIFEASNLIPKTAGATIQTLQIQAGVAVGFGPGMQPGLSLTLGGLNLSILLSEPQLASLQAEMAKALAALATKQ